jgi:hypothetical protein
MSLLQHLSGTVLHAVEDAAERHRVNGSPLVTVSSINGAIAPKPAQLTTMSSDPKPSLRRAHRAFDLTLVRHVAMRAGGTQRQARPQRSPNPSR